MQIATSRTDHLPTPPLLAPPILSPAVQAGVPGISPLMLSDHLLKLAEEADRAGLAGAATMLIGLAHSVLDKRPLQ